MADNVCRSSAFVLMRMGLAHVYCIFVDLRFSDFNEQHKNPTKSKASHANMQIFLAECLLCGRFIFLMLANKTSLLLVLCLAELSHCIQCCFFISDIDRFTRFSKAQMLFLCVYAVYTEPARTNFLVIPCLYLIIALEKFTHIPYVYISLRCFIISFGLVHIPNRIHFVYACMCMGCF